MFIYIFMVLYSVVKIWLLIYIVKVYLFLLCYVMYICVLFGNPRGFCIQVLIIVQQ